MEEIIFDKWKGPVRVDQLDKLAPGHVDVLCHGQECRRTLANLRLRWNGTPSFAWATANCSWCGTTCIFLLTDPPSRDSTFEDAGSRLFVFPARPLPIELSLAIEEDISPRFAEIYRQVLLAERDGLNELVGMGLRKALEFLIKDYLCYLSPDEEDAIRRDTLGNCIAQRVDDPRIKDCARRASWLGNDETHYTRTWVDLSVDDLKVLLDLTLHWIESDVLTRAYLEKMDNLKK